MILKPIQGHIGKQKTQNSKTAYTSSTPTLCLVVKKTEENWKLPKQKIILKKIFFFFFHIGL